MEYTEALQALASVGPELRTGNAAIPAEPPRKFSLQHIRMLLQSLRDPQTRFPSVLIAGTNGKGSTAATLASICKAAGFRTGLYTSPHLLRVNERMQIDGEPISDADFGRYFGDVWTAANGLVQQGDLPHRPSFFELLTAAAFLFFAERAIDIAILEVGLGGRLDATNVVEPLVSVITDIGLDHTEFLGHTLGEIAREKAGILRPNGVLVTLSQHPEANAAIGEVAVALGVRGVDAARCLPPRAVGGMRAVSPNARQAEAEAKSAFSSDSDSLLGRNIYPLIIENSVLHVDSPLAGQHQQRNVALAIATALELRSNHGFAISNDAIEEGVHGTRWPGRLEWILPSSGAAAYAPLLLDVAHNPAGAWALRGALSQIPEDRPRTLLFSCLADKPVEEMARILFPLFDAASGDPARLHDHLVFAPIQNPRAATVEQLLAAAQLLAVPAHAAPHVAAALAQAQALTPSAGFIVATGSVYLVGEVRALALEQQTRTT